MTDILDRLIAQEIVRFESAKGAGRCSCARCLAGPLNWAEAPRPRPARRESSVTLFATLTPGSGRQTPTLSQRVSERGTQIVRSELMYQGPLPNALAPGSRGGSSTMVGVTAHSLG